MMSASKYFALVAIFLVVTGCARTYQARHVETTGFLDDYSLLKEGEEDDALLSYWKKGVNWAAYQKIILEPVIIKKTPDSEQNGMTHADGYRLKELLDYRMQEALKKGFKLVNKPGADTLLVQFAITDVETSTVLLDMFSSVYPSARALSALKRLVTGTESFVGKASIEGKIIDSNTGDLLMASADARAGGKTLAGSTNEWDDIEQAYQYWAIQVSYQLCLRQARIDCQKPE
jgi:hypothetical protein